jgi:hypothetical protein
MLVEPPLEILISLTQPNNHRNFFYLEGSMDARADLPGLANATLQVNITSANEDDDAPPYFHKNKITDVGLFTVRFDEEHGRACGGQLVQGQVNELVGDFFFFLRCGRDEYGTDVWDLEAVTKLPDERILFALEGRVSYD